MNHYETLGILPTATQAEIDRAFEVRKLAGAPRQVYRAYWWLGDPTRRAEYDKALDESNGEEQKRADFSAISDEEFQSWLAQRGIASGVRGKLERERFQREEEVRPLEQQEREGLRRRQQRSAIAGRLIFVPVCLVGVIFAFWLLVTIIRYFWTHPLF